MSDGDLIIRIPAHLLRELVSSERPTPKPTAPPRREGGDRPWSDAQRRLLFRVLYRRGLKPHEVRAFIDSALSLGPGEVPEMRAVSDLIDRLKREDEDRAA